MVVISITSYVSLSFVPAQSVVSSAKLTYLDGVVMQTKEDVPQNDQLPVNESESSNSNVKEEIPTEIQLLITELTTEFQSDSSPVSLRRIDPETREQVDVDLVNTHPLYPIVNLLHFCKNVPNFTDLALTNNLINEAYRASKNAIEKDKTSFGTRNFSETEPVHQGLWFIQTTLEKRFCTQEYELVLMSSAPEFCQDIKKNQIALFLSDYGIAFAIKGEQVHHYFYELSPEHSQILKDRFSGLPEGSQQLIHKEDPLRAPIIEIVTSRIDEIRKKNELLLLLAQVNLDIIKLCRKKIIEQQKRLKASNTTNFENLISIGTRILIKAHFLAGNYEICESYCRDLLDFLAKIKIKDVHEYR